MVGRGLLGGGWWPLEGRRFAISDPVVTERYHDECRRWMAG